MTDIVAGVFFVFASHVFIVLGNFWHNNSRSRVFPFSAAMNRGVCPFLFFNSPYAPFSIRYSEIGVRFSVTAR
jgi:hypothetical protein